MLPDQEHQDAAARDVTGKEHFQPQHLLGNKKPLDTTPQLWAPKHFLPKIQVQSQQNNVGAIKDFLLLIPFTHRQTPSLWADTNYLNATNDDMINEFSWDVGSKLKEKNGILNLVLRGWAEQSEHKGRIKKLKKKMKRTGESNMQGSNYKFNITISHYLITVISIFNGFHSSGGVGRNTSY